MTDQRGGAAPELAAAVRGMPERGTWDRIFTLYSVDDDGFPHPCLLSRAAIDADARTFRVAVASSSRTVGYLRRRPRALLVFIGGETSYSCAAEVSAIRETGQGLTGIAMAITGVHRDSLGIPLRPASFWVSDAVPVAEAWDRSAALLAAMAAAAPGTGGGEAAGPAQ